MQYVPEKNVYVYFRYNEQESVMVIINNSPESRKIDLTRFEESLHSFSSAIDVLSNERIDLDIKKYVEIKNIRQIKKTDKLDQKNFNRLLIGLIIDENILTLFVKRNDKITNIAITMLKIKIYKKI